MNTLITIYAIAILIVLIYTVVIAYAFWKSTKEKCYHDIGVEKYKREIEREYDK